MSEALLCCLPVDHKLAKRRRIDLRQLSDEPFILFPRTVSPHYHDQIIATCVEAGFSPQIRHEARLWQTVVTMVEFQMGSPWCRKPWRAPGLSGPSSFRSRETRSPRKFCG